MSPNTIYIIRHCDKPVDFRDTSDPGACLCSDQGYLRAQKLVEFWKRKIQGPVHFVASGYAEINPDCSCSQREYLILKPTAESYSQQVELPYCFTQVDKFAEYIMSLDGTVVCGYEHHHIPLLIQALGFPLPGQWPGDRFDIVFEIRDSYICAYTEGLGLPGDSPFLPMIYWPYYRYFFILIVIIMLLVVLLGK